MAIVRVIKKWRFECTRCGVTFVDGPKTSVIKRGVEHAVASHQHKRNDECRCPLAMAVNNPEPVTYSFVVPLRYV